MLGELRHSKICEQRDDKTAAAKVAPKMSRCIIQRNVFKDAVWRCVQVFCWRVPQQIVREMLDGEIGDVVRAAIDGATASKKIACVILYSIR